MVVDILFGKCKMFIVKISDGNGILILCFFNFIVVMKNNFVEGKFVYVYGEIKCGN